MLVHYSVKHIDGTEENFNTMDYNITRLMARCKIMAGDSYENQGRVLSKVIENLAMAHNTKPKNIVIKNVMNW